VTNLDTGIGSPRRSAPRQSPPPLKRSNRSRPRRPLLLQLPTGRLRLKLKILQRKPPKQRNLEEASLVVVLAHKGRFGWTGARCNVESPGWITRYLSLFLPLFSKLCLFIPIIRFTFPYFLACHFYVAGFSFFFSKNYCCLYSRAQVRYAIGT